MKKSILLGATALLAVGAQAQTINYTALQDAFGQPVTTSATGKPQVASDAPAALRIITAAEIKESGLDNLPDVLNRYSGMDLLRWGSGSADVAVRGYNQGSYPRLLVLVNGRQVYNDHFAMVVWNTIPVQQPEIKQIEIVKGPVGAIYGFNAVAGVVNIITVNPLYDETGTATLRGGTDGKREANMVKTLKLGDRVGVKLSAGYKEQDEFDKGNLTAVERSRLTGPEANYVSLSGLTQVSDNIQWGVELSRSYSFQTNYNTTNSYLAIKYVAESAKTDLTIDAGSVGLVNLMAYRNKMDFNYLAFGASDVTTTVVQLSDLLQVGSNHTLKFTGEYRRAEMGRWPTPGATIGYDVFAGSTMWDWKVSDTVSFTNAVRLDMFSLDYSGGLSSPWTLADYDRDMTKISYNSGLVFKPDAVNTLRATFGMANQLPSLLELGGYYVAGAIPTVGNPHIDPSRITSFELGYDRAIEAINGRFGITAYRQHTKDLKTFTGGVADRVTINRVLTQTMVNAGSSSSWGLEADVNGALAGGLTYSASYTFTQINDDLTVNRGANATRPIKFEDATPKHKLRGGLGWSKDGFSADLGLTWQSDRYLLRPGTGTLTGFQVPTKVDSFVTGTATVAYAFSTGTELRATASDFLRSSTAGTAALETERRLYVSLSQSF
ncbi:MAG: TonB-dependent receptor [Niveispirillum sp.]|nr:TonB-dependent receptor [Niveispirillum sp.]